MTEKIGESHSQSLSRAGWTLVALGAGLLLGVLLHGSSNSAVAGLASAAGIAGQLWVSALQLIVVPLVVTQTLLAVAGLRSVGSIGALGGRTFLLFVGLLVAAGLFAALATPPLVTLYRVDATTAASLRSSVRIPPSAIEAARATGPSVGEWLSNLIPKNLVQAASGREIFPLLLFAIVFGLAMSHLPPPRRDPLMRIVEALAEAMLVLVGWILVITPIAVFALGFDMAQKAGVPVAGFVTFFVVLVSGLMVAFTLLLYPITAVLGRVSIARFARAVAPVQAVAASTRSSLASLPALVESARDRLGLSTIATGFVLPLSVSTFRVNQPISGLVKLIFLAHVFGVSLTPGGIFVFFLTVLFLSFSALGIPNGGSAFRALPAYLAAGIPLEGIIILEAAEAIPDIFKTVTNVTGDLSAAAILARPAPAASAAPAPAAAPAE